MGTSPSGFLQTTQNADGGWGYANGQSSTVEATCAALMALRGESQGGSAQGTAGLAWLRKAQHADGGWGYSQEDAESGWQTAWAILALASTETAGQATSGSQGASAGQAASGSQAAGRGAAWLLAAGLLPITDIARQEAREKLSIDADLYGWPWHAGEASWVEPTALAMLALHALPPSEAGQARLAMAARYLQDRRCAGGGWNFGNPVMLKQDLPPRAHPTAWALLALAAVQREAVQGADIQALRDEVRRDGSATALAWGRLALRALGEEDAGEAQQLAARQGDDGSWSANPYATAVAMIALRGYL